MAKANKWETEVEVDGQKMTAAKAAVTLYNNGEGKTPDEIADFLGEEFHGSKTKNRMVVSKLTSENVYIKPEPKKAAPREPQIVKADLIQNMNQVLETDKDLNLDRLNLDSLKFLAEHIGAEIPDPR